MDFIDALTQAYLENPCRVLPNALWKTLSGLAQCETDFRASERGIDHLQIWRENRLLLFWDNCPGHTALPAERADMLDLALIHQEDLPNLALALPAFSRRSAYFRLVFKGIPKPGSLQPGYSFRPVAFHQDLEAAAALINRCYADIHPSAETVLSWTRHPVFDPQLWTWLWDNANDRPAGLGIAELDRGIGEGSLEWIQILPEYRGLGLGRALVNELLWRMYDQAAFVTVSGEVDNVTNPEHLYRRCGFTGNDVWLLLQK